jgi:thiol-disulfide isomerase/thioredoxin
MNAERNVWPGTLKTRLRQLALAAGIVFLVALSGVWLSPPNARAQSNDDAYNSELQKATNALRTKNYEEALKGFKRANDLRGKTSAECYFGMAQAYQGLDAYKNTVDSCDKMIEFAGDDKQIKVQAYNLKGIALQSLAQLKDQKRLQEAEATFRQGLALDVELPVLRYNLGFVLLQQTRDAEGIAELKKYLELKPNGPNGEAANRMIENPRRAREPFAPDFSFTTLDGQFMELEDLRGKVVLLDFWGTWCPPCVESVPALRDLQKRFAKDSSFLMISVSVNDEEETWRAFTAKNQMSWPQAQDREHSIQRAFAVRAFPTYIVLDHEGIVRYRASGSGPSREATLEDAIRKYVKIAAKSGPN